MDMKLPLEQLTTKVLTELKGLNYADNTINSYRRLYKRVTNFAKGKEQGFFSEELGKDFLKEKYNCTVNYYVEALPKCARHAIRAIRILGDYQLHSVLIRRIAKKPNYVRPIFPHHEKSISSILTTLRVFLRFSYLSNFTANDLTKSVPKQKKYYYPSIPSTWKVEEVQRMLECIDRGNPTGKRDYAILLLVARLGIRASDVKSLKLSYLNWNTKLIVITQQKTKNTVSNSPYVFLRIRVPYEQFGRDANLFSIITKYTRITGIAIPKGKRHGLHSLRHSLASGLFVSKGSSYSKKI